MLAIMVSAPLAEPEPVFAAPVPPVSKYYCVFIQWVTKLSEESGDAERKVKPTGTGRLHDHGPPADAVRTQTVATRSSTARRRSLRQRLERAFQVARASRLGGKNAARMVGFGARRCYASLAADPAE
ncbi:hypothetical protein ACNFIA_18865 [Pseudomonas sp. NY15437]|uniref:hypothetical protein n=1 Tax=Pseudomonas sp. NY15437 TaxID=3400360 RepID=UPI003A86BEBF